MGLFHYHLRIAVFCYSIAMNKLLSNKYVKEALPIALCIAMCAFGVWYGFTVTDPGTGSFAGINFSPKQVAVIGLSIGASWMAVRSLIGPNFKEYEMPKSLIILWCVLFFGGGLIFSTLRLPNDSHRAPSGMVIFMSGMLLPFLLYIGLAFFIIEARRRK